MNVARKNLLILILLHFIFVFLSQKEPLTIHGQTSNTLHRPVGRPTP